MKMLKSRLSYAHFFQDSKFGDISKERNLLDFPISTARQRLVLGDVFPPSILKHTFSWQTDGFLRPFEAKKLIKVLLT